MEENMAKIDFNSWVNREHFSYNQDQPRTSVGYFSLKQDGQEAIVRIMLNSTDDFDIVGIHKVKDGDKTRSVSCIGDQKDPAKNCPLCASKNGRVYRFYIPLIEYVKNENGQVVGVPKIWERSSSYINKVASFISEYGSLSDVVLKVKRHGVAGSKDTTYEIMMANPSVYRNDLYPKNEDAFKGFNVLGTIVSQWNADKMNKFLGVSDVNDPFVSSANDTDTVQNPTTTYQSSPATPQTPTPAFRQYQVPNVPTSGASFERPRRNY